MLPAMRRAGRSQQTGRSRGFRGSVERLSAARRARLTGRRDRQQQEDRRDEMGTSGSDRHAVRLRNHDVHRQPLSCRVHAGRELRFGRPPACRRAVAAAAAAPESRPLRRTSAQRTSSCIAMYSVRPRAAAFRSGTATAATAPACASGTVRAKPRTQSSISVSGDGIDGVLFNASPDILQQIRSFAAAAAGARAARHRHPRVVLMDGQVDHATGLLMLRERASRCRCGAPTRCART